MEAGAVGIQIKDAADFKETVDAHGTWFDPKTVPHLASGAQVIGYLSQQHHLLNNAIILQRGFAGLLNSAWIPVLQPSPWQMSGRRIGQMSGNSITIPYAFRDF
ncbi:ribosomal protein L11 methyltransferase [Lacticaseibacillus paracasei]|nr:ribosomal protein L11 methyltransferase [Lacticaseibacillus paracasei]